MSELVPSPLFPPVPWLDADTWWKLWATQHVPADAVAARLIAYPQPMVDELASALAQERKQAVYDAG